MGRFLQSLIALTLLCMSCTASAYDFYYRSLYTPAYLTAFDGGGSYGGCSWTDSSYVVAGTDSTNHWTRYNVTMTKTSGGCGAVQWGYAYTCMSGYHWNGLLSSSTSCVTTPPPTCTPPKVAKPDGSCGDPCVVGDVLQLSGKSGYSSGQAPSGSCDHYCTYARVESGDAAQYQALVLGLNIGGAYEHSWKAKYKGTAAACTPTGNPDAPVQDTNPDFLQNPDTKNTSQWHPGDVCGYVNGNYHCTGAVPKGGCVTTPNGDGVCSIVPGATVVSPPAPDTGTAGTAAQPVASITQNSTTTNIYNGATMAGSTVGSGKGTDNATGTSTAPGGSTTGVGTQANPSVEDCSKSGTCTNATNSGATTSPTDAKDFGQSLSDFGSAVASSPVATAFTTVGSSIPTGGTAPSATLAMFGRSYTLAVPDAVASSVTSVLSLIMKAVWSLIAIRRFMAA